MTRKPLDLVARSAGASLVAAVSLALAGCGGGGASDPQASLRVMTQNLYYGAEFDPVVAAIAAGDPEAIVGAATQVWAEVRANDFATRAAAIADQIAGARPDLVGLQEAATYRLQLPSDEFTGSPSPATSVVLDYTQLLIDALAARGLSYEVVASVATLDVELPVLTDDGQGLEDLRITDHDVLLARTDREADGIHVFRERGGVYHDGVALPGGVGLPNGWVSADVWVGGRIVRVVSTHLASDVEDVQRAQAAEAMDTLLDGASNVLFLGDFNSDALRRQGPDLTATYFDVLAAGYEDAWHHAHPAAPGATWGRLGGLAGPTPGAELTERIDHVFFAGADLDLAGVDVLGEEAADRRGGLWPSDHAGVVASFRIR